MNGYFLEKTLDSLELLVDTREHCNTRAQERYKQFGVPYERVPLSIGDYTYDATLPSGRHIIERGSKAITPSVSIERKMSLDELVACFVGKKKVQFKYELQRAKDAETKLYLLVENVTWEDIFEHRYRSQIQPEVLLANVNAVQARYDVHLILCSEGYSGKLIKEILYRELKERLQNGDYDELISEYVDDW